MKSPRSLSLVALGLALATCGGCNHVSSPRPGALAAANPRAVTYALAVTVSGGLQPTPAQWASIQATFSRILAAEGLVLVTDLSLADRILRIDFLPDLNDPENRGQAVIVSVRPNTVRGSATTLAPTLASFTPYPSSFGWNGYSWGSYYGFGYDPFYGYGNSYYDGFSYGSPTLNPRRPVPPPAVNPPGYAHHHHPYPGKPDPRNPDGPRHHHHPLPPDKCPPLLAATTPASTRPDPVVYPGSAPGRNTVFQDDIRLAHPDRSLTWTTPDTRNDGTRASRAEAYRARQESNGNSGTTSAPAEHRSWLSRLVNPGDSNSSVASTSYNRGDRTYSRSDSGNSNSERTWSRGDSTYTRSDSNSSRSESYRSRSDSSANSSGGSSYSHSSSSYSPPASSSSYSSGSSSYSSGSSSSGSSSYSSSSGSSSGGSGSSGGSSSSPAPTPTNTIER